MGEFLRRIGYLIHRRRQDAELADEMEFHREMASRAGRNNFGNTLRMREKAHDAWGWSWLESLAQDTVYGVRAMLRSPVLTGVAVASLALGIGANTAIFSFLDAVLLRSLPVRDPQKLVLLGTGHWVGITDSFATTELYSYSFYRQFQARNSVFSDTAAVFSMTNNVHGFVDQRTASEPIKVQLVSGTYFSALGVQAQLGRMLTDEDDHEEGAHPVAVISERFWKRSLGMDANVVGRRLRLGTTVFTIVGVAPAEFFGTMVGDAPDAFVPLAMMQSVPPGWNGLKDNFSESLYIFGRLKPGVTHSEAEANTNVMFQQILRGFPDAKLNEENAGRLAKARVPLTPMANGLSRLRFSFSLPLWVLMTVAGLVLLIACANIANLLMARSTARARELAVRQALGASRTRIMRQLLTESLTLAVAGGGLGIALAAAANRVLLRVISNGPELTPLDVSLNLRLLGFALAVTVFTALLFGTLPALRATKPGLTENLKDGRGASGGAVRSRAAKALIVSQVALSLALMVAAGLFLRTLINLNKVDTGFNKANVLRLQIDSNATGWKGGDARLNALYQEIENRVISLPGVTAASFSSFTFHEGSWNGYITVPGMPVNHNLNIDHNVVGNGYFKTLEIPVIAGRTFNSQDTATSQHVAVISEHMAKTLFPAGNPVGRTYSLGDPGQNDVQVIGVVKDVKFGRLDEPIDDIDYVPYTQRDWGYGDFEARYTGSFSAVSAEVQETIHSIYPTMPIMGVTTLDEQVSQSITNQRLVAQLSAFFGLLAVFLSCIGIYGLMSYMVSRRTSEIGIRMALGANRSDVSWLVLREIVLLVAIGIAIGVPITLAGSRLVASLLYGLIGTDAFNLAIAVVLLLGAGLFAGWLPARRASRVNPVVALRSE